MDSPEPGPQSKPDLKEQICSSFGLSPLPTPNPRLGHAGANNFPWRKDPESRAKWPPKTPPLTARTSWPQLTAADWRALVLSVMSLSLGNSHCRGWRPSLSLCGSFPLVGSFYRAFLQSPDSDHFPVNKASANQEPSIIPGKPPLRLNLHPHTVCWV